jgi:branched-chain amino acid transport system substrate-binding protein
MKSAGKTEGVPDIYSESISASAPNYTAQCVAAKQAGVTTLFVADVGTIIEHFAADCQQQGYTPTYITEAAGFTMDQASAPGLSKDLWSQYPDVPFWANTPAVQAYDTVMDKYYPGVRKNIPIFNEDAFMGWVSAKLLQAGIDTGGLTATATPSSAEVTSGLNSLKGDTLGGLTPPLTFVAGQPHHVNCYFVGHIQNGKPTLVNNGQASCLSNASSS